MSSFGDYPGATPEQAPCVRVVAGRYELGTVLGTGAFGVVYEARDAVTGGIVAVKVLRTPGFRRHEAAALRGLSVPGVVRLLDEGEEGGVGFLVMVRLVGEPFPPDPGSGGLAWEEVRDGFGALLRTLDAIHAHGAIHLDLKPSNLLMEPGGSLSVLDFGLAALAPSAGGVGNRRYAAPEQLDGGPVDGRTDLYAVGVLIWETLAGRHPREGGDLPGRSSAESGLARTCPRRSPSRHCVACSRGRSVSSICPPMRPIWRGGVRARTPPA